MSWTIPSSSCHHVIYTCFYVAYYQFYFNKIWTYGIISSNYYYLTPCEFFTPTLAEGLSLEFEWQPVHIGVLDFSQYSGQSQKCCRQDGIDLSSCFQHFLSSFQDLWTVPTASITIGIIVSLIFYSFQSRTSTCLLFWFS